MAHKTVNVDVFDGGDEHVDTADDRPVRLMPNGFAGVVYRDAVFPLYEGNLIDLADLPLGKDLCRRFLDEDAPIPYCPKPEDEFDCGDGRLGIGSLYVESRNRGHYLAFDGCESAAERLAAAIDESGLGVVKLGKSFRPADNGQRYDWYIRLNFHGPRGDCLRVIEAILKTEVGGSEVDYSDDSGAVRHSDRLGPANFGEVAAHLVAGVRDPMQSDEIEERLRAFGDGSMYSGYLSWRFAEFSTRPRNGVEQSIAGTAEILSAIVRADKDLIARIENQYGGFLEDGPQLAQHAIDLAFEDLDLGDSWHSDEGALRRSRSAMRFLRKAFVLTLVSRDYPDRLIPMLRQVRPPAVVQFNSALPLKVSAAVASFRRMAAFVEEFFAGDELDVNARCESGYSELRALKRGDFDFLINQATPVVDQPKNTAGELPFVVLPPGQRIQSIVGDLKKSARYRDREVDFGRIKVLTDLTEMIGPEHCSLYSGIFPSSGRDNGYMVLVIAFEDYGEDAVAISPWKNEHATYVVRPSEQPWQVVLSRTKDEAIQLGARRLHFKPNPEHGLDEYEAMRDKILALLSCEDPDDFETGALYFDPYQDCYVVRESKRSTTSKPEAKQTHESGLTGFIQRIMNWFD